jgi:hypothetical protein
MKTDVVLGLAANYDWPDIEPFAVSLVRSGYDGDKVLFVKDNTPEATKNLSDLGFSQIELPHVDFSDPTMPLGKFFAYVGRFLLIHQYLFENPGYRFVVCVDTRDAVFQHNPITWMENNVFVHGVVAASEHIRHCDQEGNALWIEQAFKEVAPWLLSHQVYCSGVIAGTAEYISDLALAIYLQGRHLSDKIWGADQPAYNSIMHQAAYEDITYVPKMSDLWCLNMCVLAFERYRKFMTDLPPVRAFSGIKIQEDGDEYLLPDLSDFTILHQYDRIPALAQILRKKYSL